MGEGAVGEVPEMSGIISGSVMCRGVTKLVLHGNNE